MTIRRILATGLVWLALCGSASAEGPQEIEHPEGVGTGTHKEVESIGTTEATKFGKLATLCMAGDGNLLVADSKKKQIVVFTPQGKVIKTVKLPFAPSAMHAEADGTLYIGGRGVLAKLDKDGKVVQSIAAGEDTIPRHRASGIASTKDHLFVSFGRGRSRSARAVVIRLDKDMGNAKQIIKGLRGCCQRMDMIAKDDTAFYVAENAVFRVVKYDKDGKVLAKWGKRDRKSIAGFGACCNPMNMAFGSDGVIYTAESGLGRIKRYAIDGKFLSLVGYVNTTRFQRAGRLAASCSNIAVGVTTDGNRVFVQDISNNIIRVLERKKVK